MTSHVRGPCTAILSNLKFSSNPILGFFPNIVKKLGNQENPWIVEGYDYELFLFYFRYPLLKSKILHLKLKTITRAQTSLFCRLQELLSLSPGKLLVGLGAARAEVEDEMNQRVVIRVG